MLEGVVTGRRINPRRVLLYGTHGIGKSTWAAGAPKPLVIATEDGLDDVGVDRTPLLTRTLDVARWLLELGGEQEHDYQTVVIDTLDWLEKLIWRATCEEAGKKSIEDFGYGRGYHLACQRWGQLLRMLDSCRRRGMNVILLAHARIERFSPPDNDAYDRWAPDLHRIALAMIQEWVDEVLFAAFRVDTIKREEGFGQQKTRAVGSGERIVYTCESPTHSAKRRINLPDVMALEWSSYQQCWPSANGNIDGIVVDGSSKHNKGERK